jgi:signal recognition particle receptor subunit beta
MVSEPSDHPDHHDRSGPLAGPLAAAGVSASARDQDESSRPAPASARVSAKLVVAGGLGVGKTTLIGAVSEIPPVSTDTWLTAASASVDPLDVGTGKTRTTVGMDFGRRTLPGGIQLMLFGTPGQARFRFLWDDLCRGALGALVLLDVRNLASSFDAIGFCEDAGLPYVAAVNLFDTAPHHPLTEVREAAQLPEGVPLIEVDARQRPSVVQALAATVEHTLTTLTTPAPTTALANSTATRSTAAGTYPGDRT